MTRSRQAPPGVEYALLGFLREQPLHGYEIHQRLQAAQALGQVWHVKQAQVYALLNKLEADDLIAAEVVPQELRPPKRLLHLTVHGAAAFEAWISAPVAHGRDLRVEFLAKLFWAQASGAAAAHALIDAQRAVCQHWLARLDAPLERSDQATTYGWLVQQFRRGQIEAMLLWLNTCTDVLRDPLRDSSTHTFKEDG